MSGLTSTRRLIVAGLAAFGFIGMAGIAPVQAQDTLEQIRAKGVMVVGNSGSYPPFEMISNGELIGFDADLAAEIGKRMGVEITFEIIDFKGIIAALTSKRVDVLITAMTWTPERAERILFSEPYYNAGLGAAALVEAGISKPEDLKGKVIGLQVGSSGERYAKTDLAEYVGEMKLYDDIVMAVNDLKNRRVDAVINPLPSLRYNTKDDPGIMTTEVWSMRNVGINTRKEDTALMAEIDKHLADIKAEGILTALDAKWFGATKSGS